MTRANVYSDTASNGEVAYSAIDTLVDKGSVELDGVTINSLTEEQARAVILQSLDRSRGGAVVTVNLDHLVRCRRDPVYRQLVDQAELVVADGMPLVWASRIQGTSLPERVAGSSMSVALAADLGRVGRSLFLLGGNPGVADAAAERLKASCPGLVIAGAYCPPFGFENDITEMSAIREMLISIKPDVVYVALGSPKQERLIMQLRSEAAGLSGTWWLGVGISLSFMAGEVQRAPVLMQKLGLEWVHRLVQEPRRLFKRYLVDGVPYALSLFARSAVRRLKSA